MKLSRIGAIGLLLCAASTAGAAPMGTGTLLVEVQGNYTDNVVCSSSTSYANQTYDVFGVPVNLSTDVVQTVCQGSTVGGVVQPGHCESYPDPSKFAFDVVAATVCHDPGCNSLSFVTESVSNVTGTLAAAIGGDVTYTIDGGVSNAGGAGSTSIPGCPLVGPVLLFSGPFGINAFQTQSTPVGTNQTVSFPQTTFFNPLTAEEVPIDVAITFSQVSGAGTTTVLASSNSAAALPANFAVAVGGFQAAFLEITTTATIVPPIEICSSYADADDDGNIDGTSPPIPESALSFLHGEGDPQTFVDRTSSRDAVNNVICAQVDHLSPFAVAVRTDGICAAENDPCDDGDACTTVDVCNASLECVGSGVPSCDDGNVCTADVCQSPLGCVHPPAPATGCNASNGKALVLVRDSSTDSKDQVLFKWLKGVSPLGDFGDPTATSDYTLCAFDANKVLVSATAPAASICGAGGCWSFTGPSASPNGVKYNDPARANDGVKLVKGKADTTGKAQVLFKALGDGVPPIDLAGITYPVTVQVRTDDAACWEHQFQSADEKKNDGTLFKAVHVGP